MATYKDTTGTPRLHITTSYVDKESGELTTIRSYTLSRMVNAESERAYDMFVFDVEEGLVGPRCPQPLDAVKTAICEGYLKDVARGGGSATRLHMQMSKAVKPLVAAVQFHADGGDERARVGEMLDSYFALWEAM